MDRFLTWIGFYNLLAPLLFLPMLYSERFADMVLRRATEIIAEPYAHGPYGAMWLLWVAAANAFLGAVMLLARGWPAQAQAQVTALVLAVYAVMWLGLIVGARGPRWGRGVWVTHGLWIAQLAWGVTALRG